MKKKNFQLELDKLIGSLNYSPKLLLHGCCAPCSSYVLEYLGEYFEIGVFFYNPNITDEQEYIRRLNEEEKLINSLKTKNKITLIEADYVKEDFLAEVKGLENLGEGSDRCKKCFELRLNETAKYAQKLGYEYFTSTLSISPLKNSQLLNKIGEEMAEKYNVKHLPSDFKKREGYKRSIELSRKFNLYRQNYCGCIFSKIEAEKREEERKCQLNTAE